MNNLHPAKLLRKVLPREAVEASVSPVSVGDTYEQCDNSLSLWVVERISNVSMSSFPLVSMSRVGHPDIQKTVSLSALTDQIDYRISA
jgi:hypothetical protein